MRIYISGGCKNGKSTYGEKLAIAMKESDNPLYYVATMKPKDEEDETRIARHRKNRENLGFQTIEIGQDIKKLLDCCNPKGCFLIDSTTALLANEMFLEGSSVKENHFHTNLSGNISGKPEIFMGSSVKENHFHTDLSGNISGKPEIFMGSSVKENHFHTDLSGNISGKPEIFMGFGVNSNVYYKIAEDLCYLLERIENIIIVSDYIFSDAQIYDGDTQNYRKGLAYIDKCCARICDTVLESCFGSLVIHKGKECFEHAYKKII